MEEKENKKLVVLYARVFYPSNTGFGNSATALAECISKIPSIELVVVTSQKINSAEKELSGAKIIRVSKDGYFLIKILNTPFIKKIVTKLKLSIFYDWIVEMEQYRLALPYLRQKNLSLILFETNLYPFLGPCVVRKFPKKTAIRLHSTVDTESLVYGKKTLRKKIYQKRIFSFCKECQIITSTNTYHLNFFKKNILKNNPFDIWSKIHYAMIPNSVGRINFNFLEKKRFLVHKQRNLPKQYCFMVGKLSVAGWVQKGSSDIIKALWYLKKKNKLPSSFKIIIVGIGSEENRLRKIILSSGLKEYVKHISKTSREETLSLIKNSKFVVLPSRFEGQSMFLTEALMIGKPIITTSNTGGSAMVNENKNGLLVEIGNIKSLADSLLTLWLKSDRDLSVMGRHSKEIYSKRFSEKKIQELIINLIEMVDLEK